MSEKIWTDDLKSLFSSVNVVPNSHYSAEANMNALTRFTILAAVLFAFVSVKVSALILIISCVLIIAAYYAAKRKTTENYCNDEEIINFDCSYVSKNQMLANGADPKTYVPPIIAARSHDLEAWDSTGLVKHSQVNDSSNFDPFRSGYATCDYPRPCPKEMIRRRTCCNNDRYDNILTQTIQPGVYQRTLTDEPINALYGVTEANQFDPMLISQRYGDVKYSAMDGDYELPTMRDPHDCDDKRRPLRNESSDAGGRGVFGGVQQHMHLPVSEYKNPNHGIIAGEETIETFADNQEEEGELWTTPRCKSYDTVNKMLHGEKYYSTPTDFQNESNVFDPRFSGYGDASRGYVDVMTGQPRWFYDDVDAITRPNYISRNKIDIFPWAPTYGPDVGFDSGRNYRDSALDAFNDSVIKQRTELQERLLRKRNAEMWQLRVAPVYK